jgi:hypothetical protein
MLAGSTSNLQYYCNQIDLIVVLQQSDYRVRAGDFPCFFNLRISLLSSFQVTIMFSSSTGVDRDSVGENRLNDLKVIESID